MNALAGCLRIAQQDERRRPIRFELAPIRARIAFASIVAGILFPLVGLAMLFAPAAGAGPGETDFAAATTALRAQKGLPGYRLCPDLTATARAWAAQMAAGNNLAHNPNRESQVGNWRALGENVGMGRTSASIQAGLAASPTHLVNLLSPTFVEVGYGTALSADGHLYVDELFRTPMSGSCATAAPARAAEPSPAKSPTPAARTAVTPPAAATSAAPVTTAPDPAVVLARLARGASVAAAEDSIGRAFAFHQTFAEAVLP